MSHGRLTLHRMFMEMLLVLLKKKRVWVVKTTCFGSLQSQKNHHSVCYRPPTTPHLFWNSCGAGPTSRKLGIKSTNGTSPSHIPLEVGVPRAGFLLSLGPSVKSCSRGIGLFLSCVFPSEANKNNHITPTRLQNCRNFNIQVPRRIHGILWVYLPTWFVDL